MYVGISCDVLVAQSVSCRPNVYAARYKMLSGTSGQQVSRPKFGRKKTPDLSVRGWASYDMKLLADFEAFFFQEAYKQVIDCAFIVQVANLNFLR